MLVVAALLGALSTFAPVLTPAADPAVSLAPPAQAER